MTTMPQTALEVRVFMQQLRPRDTAWQDVVDRIPSSRLETVARGNIKHIWFWQAIWELPPGTMWWHKFVHHVGGGSSFRDVYHRTLHERQEGARDLVVWSSVRDHVLSRNSDVPSTSVFAHRGMSIPFPGCFEVIPEQEAATYRALELHAPRRLVRLLISNYSPD